MNKFDCINKVMVSNLRPEDKCLLVELITRADDDWKCWPSVERLCKVRGIKHEKNFKGADHYLPGLVSKIKKGRKNVYYLDTAAIEALPEAGVTIKHTNTPALEGVYTPAVEGVSEVNTPAVADNTPAVEGANTTKNTTSNNTTEDTTLTVPDGPVDNSSLKYEYLGSLNQEDFEGFSNSRETLSYDYLGNSEGVAKFDAINTTTGDDTPATEGVLDEEDSLAAIRAIQERQAAIRAKTIHTPENKAHREALRAKLLGKVS